MSRRLEAQGVKEDFPKFQLLHMAHREKAPDVLRGIIKKHFYIDALGDEYVIEDFPESQSLHTTYGEMACDVLRDMIIKTQRPEMLGDEYVIEDFPESQSLHTTYGEMACDVTNATLPHAPVPSASTPAGRQIS